MWLPEGTRIEETDRIAGEISDYIRSYRQTEMVSAFVGHTPPRYYLSNVSFGPQSNYAQLLIKCKTSAESRQLHALLQDSIPLKYPWNLLSKSINLSLSPLTEAVIEWPVFWDLIPLYWILWLVWLLRLCGKPKVADARNEWGNMSMMIRPVYDPVKAGVLGITKRI